MPSKLSLARPTDPAWHSCLNNARGDVYHQPGYHAFEESLGSGEAFLALIEDGPRGLAWPYLLRAVDPSLDGGSGHTDVTSVYGYPGPLAWGVNPGDPFLGDAWADLLATWREQRAVAVFTRFHPVLGNASIAAGLRSDDCTDTAPDGVAALGETISVDCSLSDEEVFANYHRALRQHLRVSRRRGMATEQDPDWRELDTFSELYAETMERNRAADHYRFSSEDISHLRDALLGHVHLLVTRLEGEVVAAGVFTEFDRIVEAHLVASRAAFRRLSPTKVLLDDARRWARERGNTVLHLGGGRGGREDSLFRFKSEFSSRRHKFSTGRWVLDRPVYQQLVAAHAARSPGPGEVTFFPAYRASATPIVEVLG